MKKFMAAIAVLFAVMALCPVTRVFSACDPEPVIVNELPRMSSGWSGSVAWYNGKIYEVADATSYANIRNPVTGVVEGQIFFGSWAQDDTKGFTYDPFRGTFWVKVGMDIYEVAVTGGAALHKITIQTEGFVFGIWCDPDEENVMWLADPVYAQIRKVNIATGQTLLYVNTDFNVRGVCRVGDTLWCTYAGEVGQNGAVYQVDMDGNQLCKFYLPVTPYDHDAGGCDIDPDGYLWLEGGKGSAIYQLDIGYVPTTPTPAPSPTPVSPVIDSGDYNGDGVSDIAIFRQSSGLWAIRGITRAYFGRNGDIPVSGDFDGDGATDPAIFRSSTGLWAVRGITRAYFGAQGDIAVPGDYDGYGVCDMAIFRPATGLWAIRRLGRTYFGGSSDQPVPLYVDGRAAGKDIAIFRPSSGLWAVKDLTRIYFGTSADIPILMNEDSTEEMPGIFRPASGLWAMINGPRTYFGSRGDQPVPGNYTGFVPADIGIFRASSGLWAVKGVTRAYFGTSGDIPVSTLSINPSSSRLL